MIASGCKIIRKLGDVKREVLACVQVNMGKMCNNKCRHCHMAAGPDRKETMRIGTVEKILSFARNNPIETLDITGGAPELNPHFRFLVEEGSKLFSKVIVRTNLTVLLEKGMEDLPDFFKRMGVELVASLPCYLEGNVDAQRGSYTHKKSVAALKLLNEIGYGLGGLKLNLVYNPGGPSLPPNQAVLEKTYKEELFKRHGIFFNRLYTITNVPISRFKKDLEGKGELGNYLKLLKENFNACTIDGLMCRRQINVAYDGTIYDCDFNQALGMHLLTVDIHQSKEPLTIQNIDLSTFRETLVLVGKHCLACTAGAGSSCGGSIV